MKTHKSNLIRIMGLGLILILVSLPVSIYTAYAHDFVQATQGG